MVKPKTKVQAIKGKTRYCSRVRLDIEVVYDNDGFKHQRVVDTIDKVQYIRIVSELTKVGGV